MRTPAPPPFATFALATLATSGGHTVAALRTDGAAGPTTAFFSAYLISALLAPFALRRLGLAGAWRLGLWGSLLGALGLWLLAPGPGWWLARGFAGGGYGLLLVTLEAWCLACPTPSAALARYLVVFYAAAAAAQLTALSPDTIALALPALALAARIGAQRLRGPALGDVASARPRLVALAPGAAWVVFGSGLVFGALYAGGPAFARAVAPAPWAATLFMVGAIVSGAWLQGAAVAWSARLGRWPVLTLACLALAGSAALTAWPGAPYAVSLLGVLGVGATAAVLYPIGLIILADRVSEAERPAASSTMLAVLAAGSALGPAVAQRLPSLTPGGGGWQLTAAVAMFTSLVALWSIRPLRRRARA